MSDHILGLMTTQIWQITALAIFVAVVVKLAAKNRPHLAHALWVLVLIKCVTPPLWGHSLGVFSQLQAWAISDETTFLRDVNGSPAGIPVAMAETLIPAPEIDMADPDHGQLETYESDELLSLAGSEPPEDASLLWDGGTGIELDEAAQTLDKQEANIAYAEPVLPVESVESDASWLHPGWLLLSGLAAGAIMTLFIMVIRCLRCLREIHRHRTTEFDDQLCERVQHLSRRLRVRRIPQIIVSDVLFGPAVLGLLRHTIVLPRCLFETAEGSQGRSFLPERTVFGRSFLPERTFAARRTAQGKTSAQRQSDAVDSISSGRLAAGREVPPGRRDLHYLDPILAHELLHIRRGDLRTGTVQAIVQSLWWFHPAVWLSNRWLSREAERCCDEQVIAELGCSPAQYARSLLSVIECKHQLQPIPVFPGMKPVEITSQRMERIMSLKNGLKKCTPIWCWLVILALAFVVLPGAVAKPSVDEVAPNETNSDTEPREKDDVGTELPEFDGNMFWSDTDLRKHLSKRERTEDIDRATTLDADCESIKLKYCEVGFFDVEVKAQTSSADDPTNHTVRFEVKEGRRYTVREVRFEGNNRISASDLQQGSILKPGDQYSAFKTSRDIQRIRELYKGLSLEPATINPVPHFDEESGVLVLVFEIDEGLTALIRLDESFIPSPGLGLSADTVLAFVGEKAITVSDVVGKLPETLKEDSYLTDEARQRVVLARVEGGLPFYLYDEVVIFDFEKHVPKPRREAIIASLESPFAELLEKICRDRKLTNVRELESELKAEGFLTEKMRESFERQQIIVGYTNSLGVDSPVRNKDSIQQYCRQLLFEARLRAKVSLDFENTSLTEVIRSLAENQGISIVVKSLHIVTGSRLSARPATVTYHGQDQSLGDAIKAIVEPFGLCMRPDDEAVIIELADYERALEKFRALPGPPSFAVFGIVKKSGWHLLDQETLLLDAIALAGGIADAEGVTIEITNPEIMSGNAVPVSMSLRVLQNDASGMLNRIVKNGDMISVTRDGSADTLPAKEPGAGVMNGKGVSSDPALAGTVRFDQPSNVADRPGRSPATSEVQDNVAGRYDGPPTPKGIGREPKLDSLDKLLVTERPMPPEIQQSSDPLVKLVWEARESSRRRLLTTDQHTPWQLMHGVLGLRQDFLLKHDGKIINGLEWIQSGPTFKDEPPFKEDQPWFQKTKHGGRAHPYLRPYLFEGHINQFAAILASCRLPLHTKFGTPDGPITMQDLITNAQMTANEKEEVSWTLSLLSRYLPPDAKWVNAKGEEWSIERLVKVEVGKSLHGAPCGGTCGLFALAVARNEYQRSGKSLEGVWLEAEEKVRRYMQTARLQQNSNGTLSSNYFRGREYKQDFNQRLASSGALLQFLITAASDEQLKEDWLRRAVESTANDLMANRKALISCAPLFETTNAFGIYLDRVTVSAVAAVKPDSKEVSLAEPLFLGSYPVADLVVLQQSVMAAVRRSTDNGNLTTRAVVPAAAVAEASHDSADRAVPQPMPEAHDSTAMPLSDKADFASLTELIKATVQPDSWDARRTIAVEEKLLSLVIRQTKAAHDEIADLLSQLRHSQDQNVRIQCLLLQLTEESQTQCVRERCSLHPGESDRQWALLPPRRSQALTQALLELKPDVLSEPQVMTISGQTATIEIGSTVTGEKTKTGIRLVMTPHLLPDTNIIRMQHAFSIGEFANEMPAPIESLVGSGQTLLLLINDPEDKKHPDAARSQYLLMMTPEHIPQKEEEADVSVAAPLDSAFAVDPADSPDK